MNNDDMNRTLAEVEGWHESKFIEGLMQRDQESQYLEDFDYPTNLEACMRVARKMKVTVGLEVWIDDGYTVSVTQGYGYNVSTRRIVADYPDNPAATLCPMLVEIAKERKG